MPRTQNIYQSDFVYCSRGVNGPTGQHFSAGNAGNNLISGLYRVQSANYGFSVAHTDVNQFGELGGIDRIILESPTVNLDFSWLQNSFYNEKVLGFTISSGTLVSAISGILAGTEDSRNYFVRTVTQGADVVNLGATTNGNFGGCYAIGNGFLSSYSAEGSVGSFNTASVNVEALNFVVNTETGSAIPAVDPTDGSKIQFWKYTLPNIATSHPASDTISATRPGDTVLTFGTYDGDEFGEDVTDLKVQNYNISFDLSRTAQQKLGSKYAFARTLNFPISVNFSATAEVGDLVSGNLVDKVESDSNYDLTLKIYRPNTSSSNRNDLNVAKAYILKGFKLDSKSFTSSIGPNKSVTLNFSSQLSGPTAQSGLFFSGLN